MIIRNLNTATEYFNIEVFYYYWSKGSEYSVQHRPGPSLHFNRRNHQSLNLVPSALWDALWECPGPIRVEGPGLNVPDWLNTLLCCYNSKRLQWVHLAGTRLDPLCLQNCLDSSWFQQDSGNIPLRLWSILTWCESPRPHPTAALLDWGLVGLWRPFEYWELIFMFKKPVWHELCDNVHSGPGLVSVLGLGSGLSLGSGPGLVSGMGLGSGPGFCFRTQFSFRTGWSFRTQFSIGIRFGSRTGFMFQNWVYV